MKILFLAKNSGMGGVVSCTANLVYGLKKYFSVDSIIAINDGEGVQRKLLGNFHVETLRFGTKNPFVVLKNYHKIAKIIKKENVDIIHAQNRIPALYASFYHFFHRRVKYIWANHLVPIPSGFFYRKLTKYGKFAVAESSDGKNMLINSLHIPAEKIKVVNLGVDISSFKKTTKQEQSDLKNHLGIKNETVIFLYGRLSPNKGHKFLFDSILKANLTNYKLIIPGEDEEYKKELIDYISGTSLEKNVIFVGFVDGKKFLSISDLMVLPSKFEGFPVSCIESFCAGVPVIRTRTGGFEDTKDFCTAVNYGDIKALSNLLVDFFENRSKYVIKAKVALANIERFSIESMTNGYYSIYEECLNG